MSDSRGRWNVLVIGATGYVGSVVAARFARAGHRISALQRPGGKKIPHAYRPVPGDLTDPPSITAAAKGFDLVLQIGPAINAEIDIPALDALLEAGSPIIYTSGIDVLGPGFQTEDSLADPHPFVGWRDVIEQRVLAAGGRLIRPGLVYGNRGGVVQNMFVPLAARLGAGVYIGEPGVRWGSVHVEDLGPLYLAVAEHAPPGTAWNGVTELARVDAIAAVVGGGKAISWPVDEDPPPEIAEIAGLFRYDQEISAVKTRTEMGWNPVHTSIIEYLSKEL